MKFRLTENKKPTEKEILQVIDNERMESNGTTFNIAVLFPNGRLVDITE